MMREASFWDRYGRLTASRRALLFAGAGSAAALLVGPACDDDGGSAGGSIDLEGTLRVAIAADTGNYDPHTTAGVGNTPSHAAHHINLLTTEPQTGAILGLLCDWSWTDGNTAIEFRLKPGIKFHNGEPFTAEAVQYSLNRGLGKGQHPPGSASQLNLVRGASEAVVLDPMTVKLKFSAPDVAAPVTLARAWWIIAPGHAERVGVAGVAAEPVGLGPFRFVSRVKDSEIRSRRNDDYFVDRDASLSPRRAWAANLVQIVRPEAQSRLAALEAGEADLAVEVSADLARTYENKAGFKVFYQEEGRPLHVMPNTKVDTAVAGGPGPNPWKDARVRKAANLAVDLDTLTKRLLTGQERPAFGPPSTAPGFPQDIVQKRFRYNVAEAKALLSAAGYGSGFETDYHAPPDSPSIAGAADVAPAIVGFLQEVGIRANLKFLPQAQYLAYAVQGQPGLFHLAGTVGDVNTTLLSQVHSAGVIAHSVDPALNLDPLVEQQSREFDAARRAALIRDVVTRFYENASWIFLYETVKAHVGSKRIDWRPDSRGGTFPELWNIKVLKG